MPNSEPITLHVLPPSHPCMTAEAALRHKGLTYELVNLAMGKHQDEVERIYGEGRRTVPGMTIGEQTVHGSTAILWKLEQDFPENPLYPEPIRDEVREAELWADGDFQDFGRRLPWSALHFRPESMGSFGGAGDLEALPGMVERIDGYAERGLIDGDSPTAADLQIGATARVLLTVADLHPVLDGSAAERVARRNFPDYAGLVPAGAFPEGWVKPRAT